MHDISPEHKTNEQKQVNHSFKEDHNNIIIEKSFQCIFKSFPINDNYINNSTKLALTRVIYIQLK